MEHENTDTFQRNYYGDGLSPGSSHQTAPPRVIFPSGTTTPNYKQGYSKHKCERLTVCPGG